MCMCRVTPFSHEIKCGGLPRLHTLGKTRSSLSAVIMAGMGDVSLSTKITACVDETTFTHFVVGASTFVVVVLVKCFYPEIDS